jgi:hypothetical protein
VGGRIKEKEMRKQFAKLPTTEQQKVEAWYHKQNPREFCDVMRRASSHSPDVIRLPPRLTATLKRLAKREGEPEYQIMITRWLKERVQKEARSAPKLSKKSKLKRGSDLKRQVSK